jgi:lipopolysaccharide transport system ATP-binding protein
MSSETAIRLRNLSKVYRIYERPEDRLIQMATLGRVRRFTEFSALSDVSLDIRRGETVGIVGRNGCGKSTLLQIICGTLQPTTGTVEVHGRIAALLELGAGFNGEFTGRENVYMNGAILGFSRGEMDARFEQIAAFAGIGDFIERPVKTYSSGMFVRLAFAVATAVEPEILVVDEALAVGDEAFQRKCFARIEAIKERGGTVLFVSHGSQTIVQLCDRAILLDGGEKILEGRPKLVVGQYQRLINASAEATPEIRAQIVAMPDVLQDGGVLDPAADAVSESDAVHVEGVHLAAPSIDPASMRAVHASESFDPGFVSETTVVTGEDRVTFSDVAIRTLDGKPVNMLANGRRYRVSFVAKFLDDAHSVGFGFSIRTTKGVLVFGHVTDRVIANRVKRIEAGSAPRLEFEFSNLFIEGANFVNVAVFSVEGDARRVLAKMEDALIFRTSPLDIDVQCSGLVDANCLFSYAP